MLPLARLEWEGDFYSYIHIRRLRCASPPVIHDVVPAGLEIDQQSP
jgi:hypothetical protein